MDASGMKHLKVAAVLGIVALILYLSLLSNNFNGDGLGYARLVEDADSARLFSVSARLFFCPAGKLVLEATHLIASDIRSVRALQILNSIFGALGVAFFFLTAFHVSKSIRLSIASALGLTFSYSYWFWCTNATSYPGNIFFLILTLYLLITLTKTVRGNRYVFLSLLIGLTHALAGFFWLTALLLVPAVMLAVYTASETKTVSGRIRATFAYLISFSFFLFVPLLIAGFATGRVLFVPLLIAGFATGRVESLSQFSSWLSAASYGIPPDLSMINFSRGIIGFSSSIVHLADIGPMIKQIIWHVPFAAESRTQLHVEITIFLLLWAVLITAIVYAIWRFKVIFSGRYRLAVILIAWALLPIIFGLVWLGSDTERWLALLPIVWLLFLQIADHGRKNLARAGGRVLETALWAVVAVIVIYNLATAFVPNHNSANNPYMQSAQQLSEQMSGKDIVLLWGHDHVFTGDHLAYFFNRKSLHIGQVGRERPDDALTILDQVVQERFAAGGRVFVSGRIFLDEDVPESHVSESEANISRIEYRALFSKYHRTEALVCGDDVYWELFSTGIQSSPG